MSAERILLYRPGFLGDVVMSMPALRLVRQYNPDAHITYSTNPPCDQLLAACPWVDNVVKAGTYRLNDYDRVCHFLHEDFRRHVWYWGNLHVLNGQEAGLIPDLAEVPAPDLVPTLWLDPLDKPDLGSPGKYIVIHTHSTNGKNWRLWDMQKWDELVRNILAKTIFRVVQLGMPGDPVVSACAEQGTDFRGKHSVMQDIWTVANASMCICIESFIAHVAHATKVPAVGPGWWKCNPYPVIRHAVPTVLLNGPINPLCIVPKGAKCVVVSNYSKCRRGGPCGNSFGSQMCESKNACMRELTVDSVWNGMQEALHGAYS